MIDGSDLAQVGKSSLGALWAVRSPFCKAGLFAYEGSDGLLLLKTIENYIVISESIWETKEAPNASSKHSKIDNRSKTNDKQSALSKNSSREGPGTSMLYTLVMYLFEKLLRGFRIVVGRFLNLR